MPERRPKALWPLFAALFLGLVAAALFQVPAVLLRPINPEGSSHGRWFPWQASVVALLVFLAGALVIRARRVQAGLAIGLTIALSILVFGGGLIAVRNATMDRDADFSTAVLGFVDANGERCQFSSEDGGFEVYVLDSEDTIWHVGDPVPFGDEYDDGIGFPSSYKASYSVEWDAESASQNSGINTIFGPEEMDVYTEPDIDRAVAQIGANDRCAQLDYGYSYVTWSDTTRAGLESQTVYIASSVCQQAIPVLKTQILASNESDCDLERSIAEARLGLDPDYDVYR